MASVHTSNCTTAGAGSIVVVVVVALALLGGCDKDFVQRASPSPGGVHAHSHAPPSVKDVDAVARGTPRAREAGHDAEDSRQYFGQRYM